MGHHPVHLDDSLSMEEVTCDKDTHGAGTVSRVDAPVPGERLHDEGSPMMADISSDNQSSVGKETDCCDVCSHLENACLGKPGNDSNGTDTVKDHNHDCMAVTIIEKPAANPPRPRESPLHGHLIEIDDNDDDDYDDDYEEEVNSRGRKGGKKKKESSSDDDYDINFIDL